MPAGEQLTQAQRDAVIAPLRARWNDNPEKRRRMYRHAQRWQDMTPEQRERAHRGMTRWRPMEPAPRAQDRALFHQTPRKTTKGIGRAAGRERIGQSELRTVVAGT